MSGKYIEVNGLPVKEPDLLKWGAWLESADRKVDDTWFYKNTSKEIRVSTVFMGLDHSFGGEPSPILYETMIFGGPFDQDMQRYSTRQEAHRGHKEMVHKVKEDSCPTNK